MRNLIIINNFIPFRKCGPEVTALLGFSSLVGAGMQNASSKANTKFQIAAQQEENQKNRDWSTEEAEKSRQFQKEMVDYQNEYNLPVNQVQRLQDANINPALAMQNGSTNTVSASPSASPQASGSMGLSPVSYQPIDLQIPALIQGMSSMVKGVADAKKAGLETSWLEKSMDLNLQGLQSDVDAKQLLNIGMKLDNALKEQKFPWEVRKAYEDARKACADAYVSFATVGKVENEKNLILSQERLNNALSKLHGANEQLIKMDIATYFKRLNSSLRLQSAQSNQANASASLSYAQANAQSFVNDMREHFKSQEYETYVDGLMRDGILSEKEHAEAMRLLRLIPDPQKSGFRQRLDDALEYVKGKVSIFK